MLVSGGNDALLFTYPANSFMAFHPFCFSPLPQSPQFNLTAPGASVGNGGSLLLSQHATWLDVWQLDAGERAASASGAQLENGDADVARESADVSHGADDVSKERNERNGGKEGRKAKRRKLDRGAEAAWTGPGASFTGAKAEAKVKALTRFGGSEAAAAATPQESKPPALIARIKKSGGEHISCAAIAPDGSHVACSDWSSVRLFELGTGDGAGVKVMWVKLPESVPAAQRLVFSGDSKRLIIAARTGELVVSGCVTLCAT